MDVRIAIKGSVIRGMKLLQLILVSCLLLSTVIFSVFYIATSYEGLVRWYKGLTTCFYREQYWETDFFTQHVKAIGNWYCASALIISLAVLFFCVRKIGGLSKKHYGSRQLKLRLADILFPLALVCICCFLWAKGNAIAMPAYDEVFSASNVAGVHPFLGASYYMLPNNHLLFNLLNHFFSVFFNDAVYSGRALSLLCYIAFAIIVFTALTALFKNRSIAFLITLAAITQFFVWGFSFQARGYGLYLLCECITLVSLFSYLVGDDKRWLALNMAGIAAGYFCMPSFLYFHIAMVVYALLYQLLNKRWQFSFWLYQAGAVALTFFFYLPALCFSGYNAIGNNHYVAPMGLYKDSYSFCQWMFPYFKPYATHIFSGLQWHGFSFDILLAIFPVVLLLAGRKSKYFIFGLFYVVLVVLFFAIVITMKRLPFERNLIGHYSAVLVFFLITVYWLTTLLERIHPYLKNVSFMLIALSLIVHFLKTNQTYLKDTLYEYDTNATFNDLNSKLGAIPAGSLVGYSDESFYCRYINGKRGCSANKCLQGNEGYFIKQTEEPLPHLYQNNYTLVFKVNEYEVFKRDR